MCKVLKPHFPALVYKLEKNQIRAPPQITSALVKFPFPRSSFWGEVVGLERRGGPETELATRHPKSYN
jgi:hypothetical protein